MLIFKKLLTSIASPTLNSFRRQRMSMLSAYIYNIIVAPFIKFQRIALNPLTNHQQPSAITTQEGVTAHGASSQSFRWTGKTLAEACFRQIIRRSEAHMIFISLFLYQINIQYRCKFSGIFLSFVLSTIDDIVSFIQYHRWLFSLQGRWLIQI